MAVSRRARIEASLTAAFHPDRLEIVDESARHAGHAGSRPEGETHFRVEIVAPAFAGLSRVQRQRLIHQALAEEFAASLHALSLKALAPDEDRQA
ncbi:MAG: BolA family transcriptional regulator [Alphaproteobacteria bacterium]|nr:BolA family transcriptional regulator [Alphaproteobacteria bacterium]